jgi:hypothetical protein
MTHYRRLTETSFRVLATLMLGLSDVRQGNPIGLPSQLGTLGHLGTSLAAAEDPACTAISASLARPLRNAEAHEEWLWDSDARQVCGVGRDALRLSLDDLHHNLELVAGAIAGTEAALACFIAERDIDVDAGSWIERAPLIRDEIARVIAGGFGMPVDQVTVSGGDVELAIRCEGDLPRGAWGLCAGLAGHLFRGAKRIRIRDQGTQQILLEVSSKAVGVWAQANTHRDLWHFVPLVDGGINAGRPPADVVADALALMLHLVEQQSVAGLVEDFAASDYRSIAGLEERLATIERVTRRFGRHWDDEIDEWVEHVSAARVAARRAQAGDFEALLQLTAELESAVAYRDRVAAHRPGSAGDGSVTHVFEMLAKPPPQTAAG